MPSTDGLAVTAPATAYPSRHQSQAPALDGLEGPGRCCHSLKPRRACCLSPHIAAGGGFEFSSQEITSGSSYQEYSIEAVTCTLQNYFYAAAPSEPWPVITYVVTLKRSDYYCAPP